MQNKFSGSECEFCRESSLDVGDTTKYGAKIIYKTGNTDTDWFATLSPKTAGNPEEDFSIQLVPKKHIKYFSEIDDTNLAKNYGVIFAKISRAIGELVRSGDKVPMCTYGKCKHPDEHIHIKLFPYRGDVAQPFTVDSSFESKEKFTESGEEFIKMKPITKKKILEEKLDELSKKLRELLE